MCCRVETPISRSLPVVILLFLMACSQVGTIKTIGIYLEDISLSLGTTSTDIGVALGLFSAFSYFPAPLIVALYCRRSFRRVILVSGSCLISLGVILTAFATDNVLIPVYLSLSGIGYCLVGISTPVALDHLAGEQNFNVLFGVGMSGFGLGMVLLPFLADLLGKLYGWRGGLLILGSLMVNLVPCAMAIQPTLDDAQTMNEGVNNHGSQHHGASGERFRKEEEEIVPLALVTSNDANSNLHEGQATEDDISRSALAADEIKNESLKRHSYSRPVIDRLSDSFYSSDFYNDPLINIMFIAELMFGIVYCSWHAFLVPHAIQRGYSIRATIFMTLFASVGNFLGRLLAGALSDRLANPINLYLGAALLNGCSILCDVFLHNYFVMLVTACVSAISIAGISVLGPLAIKKRATPTKFDVAYAVNAQTFGVGNFLGGYISGAVAGLLSSYNATFKFLAGVNILVFFLMLPVAVIKKPLDR